MSWDANGSPLNDELDAMHARLYARGIEASDDVARQLMAMPALVMTTDPLTFGGIPIKETK